MRLITLQRNADPKRIKELLREKGLWIKTFESGKTQCFLIEPHSTFVPRDQILAIPGVKEVLETSSAHPLMDTQSSQIQIGKKTLGLGKTPIFLAGPCSIESEEQIFLLAQKLSQIGVSFLRGGAFKPRTSPYAFQGNGKQALRWLRQAADAEKLLTVTEVLDTQDVEDVAEVADLIQIGTRNMYNYALLKRVGETKKPVLLKRGFSATVEEWLCSAEYCLLHGSPTVVLCERGIRSFDKATRNVLDVGTVALLAHEKRLPVIVDPSHAAGRRDLIAPLSKAAIAAGACGLMIETHLDPGSALSDGPQALQPDSLALLIQSIVKEPDSFYPSMSFPRK